MKYNFDELINRKGTYCSQWDFNLERFGSKDVLPFSISDTDFKIPKEITEVLANCINHQVYGYTRWNHNDFKESIMNFYQRRHSIILDKESIVYSPTVMYSISLLLELLSNEGDAVLTCNPMYDAFFNVIQKNNRVLLKSELQLIDNRYQVDFKDIENKLSKAKIFLLCSPHNPTGKMWLKEELDTLVSLCKKYQVKIISDEIHSDMILSNQRYISILEYQKEYTDIYMVSSASKTYNTPALLGSYACINNEEIREQFNEFCKNRDFVGSAILLGIQATMTGYRYCDEYIEQLVEYIKGNMQVVERFIKDNFNDISFTIPEATYLAWLDLTKVPFTMQEIQEALITEGKVGIMDGNHYGKDKYLRMNIGCPRSKVEEGLQRLKKALDYLYKTQE